MMKVSSNNNIFILPIILIIFINIFGNTLLFSQTNQDQLNNTLKNLSSQNRINLLLDSAKKYFNSDLVKCMYYSDLAGSNIDDKITDAKKVQVYSFISKSCNMIGNYAKSLEYLLTELKILEKNSAENVLDIGNCYVNIGETYRAAEDYDNSLINLNKSISIFSKLNNDEGTKGLSYSYERLAAVYFEIGYNKSDTSLIYNSIDFSNKSIEISAKFNLIARKINNWNIIGVCQNYLKNYDKALEYFENALTESYKDSTYSDRCNILNNLSSCNYHIKKYDKSIEYALKSYNDSKNLGITVYTMEACYDLYLSYSAIKQYEKAIAYLNEYNAKSTILHNEEKNKAMYMLQQKALNEKKDEETDEQKAKLIYLTLGVLTLLAFVILVFLLRQISLKKINNKLECQNIIISKQKSELEELNATKNRFFSILSHDLRNPFNGILGFLNILKNDFDALSYDEKRQYIGYINTSANQVFKLLDRLLQLSRLQDGRYHFNIERLNVKEMSDQVFHLQETNAFNKRVKLMLNIIEDIYINVDKTSFEIVLRNLVDNARSE